MSSISEKGTQEKSEGSQQLTYNNPCFLFPVPYGSILLNERGKDELKCSREVTSEENTNNIIRWELGIH